MAGSHIDVSPSAAAAARSAGEVARSYFAAVAARDADGMAAHWHEDGVEDIVAAGIFRGPEEVRGFFTELFGALPDAETIVERVLVDGDTAIVLYRIGATFTGKPLMGLEATGGRVEIRGCDVLDVRGGLIERNTAYYDGMAMARGIGLLPSQESGAEKAMFTAFNALTKVKSAIRERGSGGAGSGAA